MSKIQSSEIEMDEIMQLAVDEDASDIHLAVGAPPVLRISGNLHPLDATKLTGKDTERFADSITPEEHKKDIEENGGTDFGYSYKDAGRFRVAIFRQKRQLGLVLRLIPSELMSLEKIGLPKQIKELLFKPRGLILVTGPTGSGKTTTLASMLDVINRERDCHIITVEDPVEYFHHHKQSLLTQRELGEDVNSFSYALRAALRQDPDVMLVGEMRDLETMRAAITAAETGHLVFATLHTTGAARTVDRIVDAFPVNQQGQVRVQLASNLVAVISQILLKRTDTGGRIAAFEIMVSTPSIEALIREQKTYRIQSDIQTGARFGMIDLDASLAGLYGEGVITYDDAIASSKSKETLEEKIGN